MKLELLELGQETEQLSLCRISLILGVYSSNNLVDTFCRIVRKLLRTQCSILGFYKEPYLWHSSPAGFHALQTPANLGVWTYLQHFDYIDQRHPEYAGLSAYVKSQGVEHERLVAFNLKVSDSHTVGQVIFFDDQTSAFEEEDLVLVKEFTDGLVRLIRLHEDYNELKELYEQQCALNFSKTKFFQIIAHDLRAPFHGLLGFSEVLAQERDTLDETSIQNIADYLYDNAQATYNLLESLLTWAMAEGGRFIYHPINFELSQSSKIVCDVLKSLAVKKQVELIDNVPAGLKVHADINMITSVIQNLVSNALKFTPVNQQCKVTISAKLEDDAVVVSVQDMGIGMTQEQIDKLFVPNLVVSVRGTAQEKGAGLGLVLCKRFVDLNHGRIHVESKEGCGSTFHVYLPKVTHEHQALTVEKHHAEN
ncbi:two-component sensor histidine kinase [Acinetobacter sp. NCu2D-2]|uniref:sensor histidine kinase n=1 Tax=Acinetobacter sp. NCu2D-2 TaxID=1608473 RepID=UPI0007CE01A9|nr:HAMP domain-containing sensor histidine kinase [Acinetobacter sp. NCu2D-2]ANF81074.1 two-component sensor histidine kinase [Acinetobacter sp. NCu2D-2]